MKHWIKGVVAVVLATTMLVAIVGCGKANTKEKGQADKKVEETQKQTENQAKPEEPKKLEDVHVVLDWYPNAIHTFLLTAIEKGYYKDEGLNVILHNPANPNDAITLPAAGKADIGMYYPFDVIRARVNQNIPVKAIASICQHPLNVVVSLKEKNIKGADDLAGKVVAFSGDEVAGLLLNSMKMSNGKPIPDIKQKDVGFDLLTALTTKQVDAAIGCLVNHEVPVLEHKGLSVNYFYPTDFGIPNYNEEVFVTSDDTLKNKKDMLVRFLKASKKGFDDVKKDPKAAIELLMKKQEADAFPLTKEVEAESLKVLLPVMETSTNPFLSQDKTVFENNIKWLKENGKIKKDTKVEDIMVNLLPK